MEFIIKGGIKMSQPITIKRMILKILPLQVRLFVINVFLSFKRKGVRDLDTPSILTLFVTNRCNLKCAHCFFWESLNTGHDQELTVDQIKKVAASLKRKISLSITGGEPFLRKDLIEVCLAFSQQDKLRDVGMVTNGFYTERVVEGVKELIQAMDVPLSIQISIDGKEEIHDEIRGVKGSFKKAMETLKLLTQLRDENPGKLSIAVAFSIQKKNYLDVEEFIDQILQFRVPIRFLIVRGESFGLYDLPREISTQIDPKNEESGDLTIDVLENVFRLIKEKNDASFFKFWGFKEQRIIDASLRTMERKSRQLPCYAGALEGILYSNGDVAFCEFTKPFGNLKSVDYDLGVMWNSTKANETRRLITHCACIHSCALGTSLHLNDPVIVNEALMK